MFTGLTVSLLVLGAPVQQVPEGWDALVGSRIRVVGLLRPSMSEHEQSLMAPHLRDPGTPKKEPRMASKLIGSRVRVSGIAENAKGGAVLMIDQAPFYLEGLDRWPGEVRGKRLAVGGKLVAKEYLPQSFRDAGSQNVIESPTWRMTQEPPK